MSKRVAYVMGLLVTGGAVYDTVTISTPCLTQTSCPAAMTQATLPSKRSSLF